jgi:hypothetical protein
MFIGLYLSSYELGYNVYQHYNVFHNFNNFNTNFSL